MKIKTIFKNICIIIDPGTTIRLWTLEFLNYHCGYFKSFWFKTSAIKHYNKNKGSSLFIDIKNEITGKTLRLEDNRG